LQNDEQKETRRILEWLYEKYNRRDSIAPDPLQFVYRYSDPADMEIAGFLASCLAYGRVEQIERDVNDLLGRMGDSPAEFVRSFDGKKKHRLRNFKHRFTTGDDICNLLCVLRTVLEQSGSIEAFFIGCYDSRDPNVASSLARFCDRLLGLYRKVTGRSAGRGLRYLLPSPAQGSACKRLNLFLRWMVRKDAVDAGLWRSIDKAKLIVPVDVHMARLCRILGLHDRNTANLAMALEITAAFAQIEPSDPVKYDFALSRIGIIEDCNGSRRVQCEDCELLDYCRQTEGFRR